MSKDTQLSFESQDSSKKNNNVENYEFEPIKGYPMLNWKGKRPFTSTQYFPAQLKESYGKVGQNGWINKVFWGDNLQVLSHLIKQYRGKVDLIYIDPPFDSKADYRKKIELKGNRSIGDYSVFEEKQYGDIWANDDYLQFMYERMILMRELLSDTGSIYLHCDWHKSHYLRILMDEIFGSDNFLNEIIWRRTYAHSDANKYGVIHDTILFYSKTKNYKWNTILTKPNPEYIETFFDQIEKDTGRRYARVDLTAAGVTKDGPTGKPWRGINPSSKGRHWAFHPDTLEKMDKEGRIHWPKNGVPRQKKYADEFEGIPLQDIWIDVRKIHNQSVELLGYPTQKPLELAERIILASSDEGDLVLDCFSGSGTTLEASLKHRRRFIGADINKGAIDTITRRLHDLVDSSTEGFQVYNVNNYDVFRNPVQAKELIMETLEITKVRSSVYDGEKDGRMVKIMPVNRIASKGDLSDLISGFDYRTFEKRQNESPNKAVEKILLVCMGHEPDLKAYLEKEVNYKLDIEIVDILRDKQDLQFKRESEAKIKIKKEKLVIEKFYPMNLLQKLSLQKEKVTDWRELVESVLIDWNYDGAVLEPQVIDIPEKEEFVKGEYDVPESAGTIRVKITDLLSESIEVEVKRD